VLPFLHTHTRCWLFTVTHPHGLRTAHVTHCVCWLLIVAVYVVHVCLDLVALRFVVPVTPRFPVRSPRYVAVTHVRLHCWLTHTRCTHVVVYLLPTLLLRGFNLRSFTTHVVYGWFGCSLPVGLVPVRYTRLAFGCVGLVVHAVAVYGYRYGWFLVRLHHTHAGCGFVRRLHADTHLTHTAPFTHVTHCTRRYRAYYTHARTRTTRVTHVTHAHTRSHTHVHTFTHTHTHTPHTHTHTHCPLTFDSVIYGSVGVTRCRYLLPVGCCGLDTVGYCLLRWCYHTLHVPGLPWFLCVVGSGSRYDSCVFGYVPFWIYLHSRTFTLLACYYVGSLPCGYGFTALRSLRVCYAAFGFALRYTGLHTRLFCVPLHTAHGCHCLLLYVLPPHTATFCVIPHLPAFAVGSAAGYSSRGSHTLLPRHTTVYGWLLHATRYTLHHTTFAHYIAAHCPCRSARLLPLHAHTLRVVMPAHCLVLPARALQRCGAHAFAGCRTRLFRAYVLVTTTHAPTACGLFTVTVAHALRTIFYVWFRVPRTRTRTRGFCASSRTHAPVYVGYGLHAPPAFYARFAVSAARLSLPATPGSGSAALHYRFTWIFWLHFAREERARVPLPHFSYRVLPATYLPRTTHHTACTSHRTAVRLPAAHTRHAYAVATAVYTHTTPHCHWLLPGTVLVPVPTLLLRSRLVYCGWFLRDYCLPVVTFTFHTHTPLAFITFLPAVPHLPSPHFTHALVHTLPVTVTGWFCLTTATPVPFSTYLPRFTTFICRYHTRTACAPCSLPLPVLFCLYAWFYCFTRFLVWF